MPPFSISPKSPLNASPRWHGKRNFIAPISTVIKRTYCTRICSSYTQTLSQVHFLFAASQTPFHHNRLVAICLMHFSIINKCHWLRSRDKPLCQGFLLESAQFKAFQCRGKLHNNYLTFPSKVLWVFVCVCEGGREEKEKGLTRKIQLFWRSLYYTWKDAVSEASWELHTGNRFAISSNSSQLLYAYKKIRPPGGMRLQFQW